MIDRLTDRPTDLLVPINIIEDCLGRPISIPMR